MNAALRWLASLGWRHRPAAEAARWRGGPNDVLLRPRLIQALQAHRFDYRGERYPLSPGGIDQVVREVEGLSLADGLLAANERFYRLLTLGVTVTEFMPDGKKHQPTVPLVDWQTPDTNQWDAVESPELHTTIGAHPRRPGVLGYVNGLPLVVIEGPASGGHPHTASVHEAIQRQLHHQRPDETPGLFVYAQLLLALGADEARYATTGTPPRAWARWREEPADGPGLSEPERTVRALLRPERLLELLRHFILFDRRLGKVIARPHQYFGVRAMLQRIQQRRADGARQGGVLWHTTGSGKSLTMVFLARVLVFHPNTQACRVLVVTDRLDLEDQLARNFTNGGAFGSAAAAKKDGEKARVGSGRELARRIGRGSERIVFTLVHKFATAAQQPECYNPSADIVALVDEGHRSHGGQLHERLRRVLPRAACLAFTGTPLLKEEKTSQRFGPIVHAYTLRRAVDDGTVVPLLYEERVPEMGVDHDAANHWFDRVSAGLTPEQTAELMGRYTSRRAVYGAPQRIELIAWDIAQHFERHVKRLGLKGQVATASKLDAIRYHRCLEATGLVSSAVIMSPPDNGEGHDAIDDQGRLEVQRWWDAHVGRDAQAHENRVLRDFSGDGGPDLLIVVDRLLTGFDEPRNAVLYIDKPLKAHNLIQAVARVNRLHEAKRHGLLVDYRGILRELDSALRDYQNLEARTQGGYELDDVEGLYRPVSAEYRQLPTLHAALRALFGEVRDPSDLEQYRQALMPRFVDSGSGQGIDAQQQRREAFYAALRRFTQCLQTAEASRSFFDDPQVSEQAIATYRAERRFFNGLRRIAQGDAQEPEDRSDSGPEHRRHAEGPCWQRLAVREPEGAYLLNPPARTDAPERWSVEKARNEADLVRTRLRKTIQVELADDPYAQTVFADQLKQAVAQAQALFDQPLKQYMLLVRLEDRVATRTVDGLPSALADHPQARAYCGICRLVLGEEAFARTPPDAWARQALSIDAVVGRAMVEHSLNPHNIGFVIRQALLPELFALMGLEQARAVIERVVEVARVRMERAFR